MGGPDLPVAIRNLGFDVIENDGRSETDLGQGVQCRIMGTYADDTLCVVSAGGETCINLNDFLHSARGRSAAILPLTAPTLRSTGLCFLRLWDCFPFSQLHVIPGKNPTATAAMRQAYFNRVGEDSSRTRTTLRLSLRRGCRVLGWGAVLGERASTQCGETHGGIR